MADDQTLKFYADNAATYVQHASGVPSRQLVAFADALPQGGAVLELGTGSGKDAAYLLSRGFDVQPSDGRQSWPSKPSGSSAARSAS